MNHSNTSSILHYAILFMTKRYCRDKKKTKKKTSQEIRIDKWQKAANYVVTAQSVILSKYLMSQSWLNNFLWHRVINSTKTQSSVIIQVPTLISNLYRHRSTHRGDKEKETLDKDIEIDIVVPRTAVESKNSENKRLKFLFFSALLSRNFSCQMHV